MEINWIDKIISWQDTMLTHPKSFRFHKLEKNLQEGSISCEGEKESHLQLNLLTLEVFQKYIKWSVVPSEALQSDESLRKWCSWFVNNFSL